ncbi:hypothetical protein [Mesorhizobium sp. P5_C1]
MAPLPKGYDAHSFWILDLLHRGKRKEAKERIIKVLEMAEILGWQKDGQPHRRRVSMATEKLTRAKLANYTGRKWKLTAAGQDAASDAKAERFKAEQAAASVSRFVERNRCPDPSDDADD